MRYILKAENYDRREGKEKKLYCIIAGSAVKKARPWYSEKVRGDSAKLAASQQNAQ
jgi:hypothetical protein